jgi:hypothetical protein
VSVMARPVGSTRLYFHSNGGIYRRLGWIRNSRPNELLVGLYGHNGAQPTLRYMWPEREIANEELSNVSFRYDERMDVGRTLDHFTCHANGRFHVKTTDNRDRYIHAMRRCQPLGRATSSFLDLMIISDLPEYYAAVRDKVRFPHVWINVPRDRHVAIRARFAGAAHNLEAEMASIAALFPGVTGGAVLRSGTIKGVLLIRPQSVSAEAAATRPRGTIVSFQFPLGDGRWHIKAFLFE